MKIFTDFPYDLNKQYNSHLIVNRFPNKLMDGDHLIQYSEII